MFKLLLITFLVEFVTSDENYCDPGLCPAGVKHIACGSSGDFDPSCPANRQLVALSDTDIQSIVDTHNRLRNLIANGDQSGFNPASRMATMTWSPELAALAELNVKQCKMSHDACHATSAYKFSGQNLGTRSTTGDFEPAGNVTVNVINGWYSEVKDASQADIDKCCNSVSGKTIGHFTVVVTDRATQVGCALSTYTEGIWRTSLMACNYAFTNLVGAKVYKSGETASGCTTGVNSDYPALCSVDEPIKATP